MQSLLLRRVSNLNCPAPARRLVALQAPIVTSRTGGPTRAMASAAYMKKPEWLVMVPDHEGALAKRMEVRA